VCHNFSTCVSDFHLRAGWLAPKKEKMVVETTRNECLRWYVRVTLLLEMQLAIFAGKTPNEHRGRNFSCHIFLLLGIEGSPANANCTRGCITSLGTPENALYLGDLSSKIYYAERLL
jgi:hypothetical protein